MKLTNAMEQAVRLRLGGLRARLEGSDETCWCPLCRADVMALALTSLPPRYTTRHVGVPEIGPQLVEKVQEQTEEAVRQVQRFPKHVKGSAVAAGAPVWVVNFSLEESFQAVDHMLHHLEGACDCWHCRCDMVAFALNRYPARYGVEHEGQTHFFTDDRAQMRAELVSFLELAVQVVTKIPRHEFSTATV